MLFFPFVPWRSAATHFARCWAPMTLALGMTLLATTALAQNSAGAEEAIKKAIQNAQLDRALKLVQIERKNAPQVVQWQFMEGVIQAQQGQVDKAIETFKKITQTHPEQSEAYNNLGVLYASKGQLETSKTFLEKALQTHPSYAAAHRNLSDVHSQLAKQNYAKALQVDPKIKMNAPQLTLLGSLGSDQRPPPRGATVAANTPPTPTQDPLLAKQSPSQLTATQSQSTSAPQATGKASTTKPASGTQAQAQTPPQPRAPSAAPQPALVPNAVAAAGPAVIPPAVAKPQISAAVPQQPEPSEIRKAVKAWAKAWSDQDMTRYYAAYANQFIPANGISRAQWESDRRVRIETKKTISVELRDVKVTTNGDTAKVRFQQIYNSDNLKGSSRKTLDMVRQGQNWLIVRESVN